MSAGSRDLNNRIRPRWIEDAASERDGELNCRRNEEGEC